MPGTGMAAPAFAVLFLMAIAILSLTGTLSIWFLAAYAVLGCTTFLAYAIDKSAAKEGRRRTPESTLHLFALLGGWPGALAAQRVLRHKSVKEEFQNVFRATVFLHCAAMGWLLWSHGAGPLSWLHKAF
jgi:uncharacterized membrane protein YsdA (DUF1294 family)